MIKCTNCGIEFSLFTEGGFELRFPNSEAVREMMKVCGNCEKDSSCLEWVDIPSKIAAALKYAYEYHVKAMQERTGDTNYDC